MLDFTAKYVTLWNVDGKIVKEGQTKSGTKYGDVKFSTSSKDASGKYVTDVSGTFRIWKDSYEKFLTYNFKEKDRINITRGTFTSPYNAQYKKCFENYTVWEFEPSDTNKKSNEAPKQPEVVPTQIEPIDIDELGLPF